MPGASHREIGAGTFVVSALASLLVVHLMTRHERDTEMFRDAGFWVATALALGLVAFCGFVIWWVPQ